MLVGEYRDMARIHGVSDRCSIAIVEDVGNQAAQDSLGKHIPYRFDSVMVR